MKPTHACASRFRHIGLLLCSLTVIETLQAQTPEDSIALTGAAWETVETDNGLTIKSVDLRLFDSDQQIYCVEFNPQLHRLQLKQGEKRETVKRLGKKEANAEVAKFNAMYEEYSKNPEVTKPSRRLPTISPKSTALS